MPPQVYNNNSQPSLEDLNIEADRLITHSMAANTWKTYKTAVDSINEFPTLNNAKNNKLNAEANKRAS
jgi:hypothetical protein